MRSDCLCDESGHTKFPCLHLQHVTLLTLAHPLLRICSGWLTFAQPSYHFQQAAPQHAKSFQLQLRELRTGLIYKDG